MSRRDDTEGFHLTLLPVLGILTLLNGLTKFVVLINIIGYLIDDYSITDP